MFGMAAGPNNTWSNSLNWVGGVAPTNSTPQVTFAGTTQTNVNMETNYTLSGLNFSNNAGMFNITNTADTLTLGASGFVINNSTNVQTLGVPINLGSAALAGGVTVEALSNNLVLNQALSDGAAGSGSLTTVGPNTTTLSGTNTYTGTTTIQSGTLAIADPGQLGAGAYATNITDNGTLSFASTASQTLTGVISGTGGVTVGATNSTPGTVLLQLNNATVPETYTGPTVVNAGELDLNFVNNIALNGIYTSSSLTINTNGIVMILADNSLSGNAAPLGTLPITVNAGGVLTGMGNSSHLSGLLTLNGGTLTETGGGNATYGTWDLDDGMATAGGPITSTISSPSVATSQAGGTIFNIPSGGTPSGIDLNITGFLSDASALPDAGVIKNGNGTMQLSGVNTYIGNTTINAGQFILADPGQLNSGSYAGNIINNATFISTTTAGQTLSGVISGTGSLETTGPASGTAASLTLSGVNTYSGPTIVGTNATLYLSGAGSISDSSSITISNSATLDVSATSSAFDLLPGQNLYAGGVVNGAFASSATSGIFPGTDGTYGTNTFNTSLTLGNGATLDYDVGTVYNGANDQLVVTGPLTVGNNVFIHFKAPSSSSSLDTSGNDYVLIQASSITGNFASAPAFVQGSVPVNGGNFSVVTDPVLNQVRLHYSTTAAPLITSASAAPSPVVRNGSLLFSVNVTPGAGTVTNVSVDLSALGGTSIVLVQQGATSVYTNTITIPPGAATGTYNLTASATDTTPLSGAANISFVVSATTETWNGGGIAANANWDTGSNWVSQLPPGFVGDSLVFAGSTGLSPVVDQDYTVQALIFSNTAGAFAITNANGNYLTFLPNSGLTNNSASVETLNVPVVLQGALSLKSATATDSLVFNQPVGETPALSGNGVLINAGGTNILNSTNTYNGNTVVSAGTLTIGPGGDLGDQGTGTGGIYVGNITNNGTFNYNGGVPQILGGVISGNGTFNINGGGTNNNAIVTITNGNSTLTGNISLTNTYVSVTGAASSTTTGPLGNPSTNGSITVNNGAILSLDGTGGGQTPGGYELYPFNSSVPKQGLVINQGGLVQVTAGGTTPVGPLTMNGGILNIVTAAATGGNPQTQPIQLTSTVTVGGTTPSLITNNPSIDGTSAGLNLGYFALVGNTTFTVANTGSGGPDLIVAAPLANISIDGGTSGILKAGAGTMELVDRYSTYSGATTITAGTLMLADPAQLGSGTYAAAVGNSGTLIVSTTVGQTFSGVVSGTGNLIVETNQSSTVNPTATFTLTGASTYTGSTTIGAGGDLVLNGSINNSTLIDVQTNGILDVSGLASFTVNASQTLRGSGTVLQNNGSVTLINNGTLKAGETNAMGTLTLSGPLTLNGAGSTMLRINKTGSVLTSDSVAGITTATYGGTLSVTNTGTGTLALNDSFALFGATSGTGNFSSIVVSGVPPGYGFTFFPNTGVLTLTSVVNTNAATANFAAAKVGGTLQLSWAPDHQGWQLYTNSVGLNTTNWFPVPGSASVTNETISIIPSQPQVFFQLRYP